MVDFLVMLTIGSDRIDDLDLGRLAVAREFDAGPIAKAGIDTLRLDGRSCASSDILGHAGRVVPGAMSLRSEAVKGSP